MHKNMLYEVSLPLRRMFIKQLKAPIKGCFQKLFVK